MRDCEHCKHYVLSENGYYSCDAWNCVEEDNREVWKPVVGYEGYYEVSNKGNVRGVTRVLVNNKSRKGIPRKFYTNWKGYLCVCLSKEGKCKGKSVHRLVAEAFIPNPNGFPVVNHKDENKKNNTVDNLEWCDYTYNNNYGKRREKVAKAIGHPVTAISKNGVEHYYSLTEAALRFDVHPTTISRAIKSGKELFGRKWVLDGTTEFDPKEGDGE